MSVDPESPEIVVTCTDCGEELDPCEIEDPRRPDEPGLCDDCSREFYEFTCCWCEDYDGNEYQHVLLVVFNPEAIWFDLPGLYRIDRTPYYTQPMIGPARVWEDCLTWLGFLPGCHADGYPCGHLCRACQRKALAEVLYDTRCGVAALSVLAP